MNKKTLSIIKNITPVLIFNILFFITWGIRNPASVWISYVLIHVAYGAFVFSPWFNKDSKKNGFFSFTNTVISLVYCIAELISGLVFIILSLETVNICLYVQLPLLGIYLAWIICNIMLNQNIESNETAREKQLSFLRQCELKLSLIMAKHTDPTIIAQLKIAKELIETSPNQSYTEVQAIEAEMLTLLDQMEDLATADSESLCAVIQKFIHSVNERNMTIQSLH